VIEERKMETIGEPKIDDVVFEEGKPLTYVATIIIQPEVKFEGYKGISLNRKVEAVTDKEIDERIDYLRHRAATHAPVERGIKAGDIVTTDFTLKCGDKTLRDVKDAQFIVDGESFFGLKVGSLEKLFAKKKTGEGLSLTVTLPDRFREEEYRGKEAALGITVKEVKEEQMPEADDEWAKKLDYDDVAELREELKKEAQKHHELLSEVDLRNQVRTFLVEKAEFDLPEELVKDQVEAYFRRKRLEMEDLKMDPAMIEKEIEDLRKTGNKAEENARKMLKGYFILRSIAEREKVFVTEDEIAKQLAVIAAQYGRSTEDMAGLYEETGLISELRTDMREKKTIDFIIKNAEIKEA
jgi:trigger factor